MAEYGEWNRKGATLSDVTAKAEYGVSRDFIVKGIQTGKLEYREGSIWGNPYLRVLRSQLEKYIAEELGEDYLLRLKNQTELRRVKKEISDLKQRLEGLQQRKNEGMTNHRTIGSSGRQPLSLGVGRQAAKCYTIFHVESGSPQGRNRLAQGCLRNRCGT